MLGAFFRTAGIVLLYALISGAAAWVGAETLPRIFGACTGPSIDCGYERGLATVLIYYPLLWLVSFVLLFATRRQPIAPLFEGRWIYLIAPAIFVVIYAFFLVLALL